MIVVSVALAVWLLYLAVTNIDWSNFLTTLKNARYGYLPIVFLWSSIGYFIRALRLRVLLASKKRLPLLHVFFANMAGYLGNNVLPARGGELVRASYLARQSNLSFSFSFAVGLVERFVDMITLIVLGLLALAITGIGPVALQNALKGASILGLVGLLIVFIFPRFATQLKRWVMALPLLKKAHKRQLANSVQDFLNGFKALNDFERATEFMGLTGLIWLMDTIGTVMLAYILKIPLLFQQALVLLAALGLSSVIPSTPGYVGVYQFVAFTVLVPFRVSKADALAYILIFQIVSFLVIGLWGLASLWQLRKDLPQDPLD
jgi:hypothetical protein